MGKVVCAWCGTEKGEFDGEGISHGICSRCLAVVLAEMDATDGMTDDECVAEEDAA